MTIGDGNVYRAQVSVGENRGGRVHKGSSVVGSIGVLWSPTRGRSIGGVYKESPPPLTHCVPVPVAGVMGGLGVGRAVSGWDSDGACSG